jgi:prefoldin subunit 5
LKAQILKLDKEIAEVQLRINNHDKTIKELRKLHEEVRFLNSKRSTLFALQEQLYAKLAEDVEGVVTLAT